MDKKTGKIHKRNIFVETVPLEKALETWLERLAMRPIETETIETKDSLGRVTASAVFAGLSSPFFHSSAMDGYAVRFADTFGASETTPLVLKINEKAIYVDTGDPMPEGMNAVIMMENANVAGDSIEITEAATPWQNVRTVGEDIVATELIIPENHLIRPVDMGAMLAGGRVEVSVRRRPKVAIIPTGTEIVEPGTTLKRGDIIEYNSRVMEGLVRQWGGEPIRHGIVPDDLNKIKTAVSHCIRQADIVAVNAGASAGSEDYTASVIGSLGELFVHGLSIKPGKPALLGIIDGKPVIGVPGYPVSTYIIFNLFVRPLIRGFLGLETEASSLGEEKIQARLSRQTASVLGQEEFMRVKLGKVGDNLIATPLGRGAGLMMSLVRADGFLRIPAMSEGLAAGAPVEVELVRAKKDIENTIVSIGSHDNSLDILANSLKKRHPAFSLSSAHVGSMGGLTALKRGEAHMAPTHLLDEESGEYNVSFIKKLLAGRKTVLINLVYREQGLMVLPGNPKGIREFIDLLRDDVVFINRQRGAGTRLLLDKHLKDEGIDPAGIKGYEREEYTHMAVASAVLTGVADAGLGVLSAANALGLDFVPVANERYDLAMPEEFLDLEMMKALLEIIDNDDDFKKTVLSVGGYDVKDMGKIMWKG